MKVIIAGGRSINDFEKAKEFMEGVLIDLEVPSSGSIISGTALGADFIGELIAREKNIPVLKFPPDWAQFGKRAGPIRNKAMALVADALFGTEKGKA